MRPGILYAPDNVINGGGIINVAVEILRIDQSHWVQDKLTGLRQTLIRIFEEATRLSLPTGSVADRIAAFRLKAARSVTT